MLRIFIIALLLTTSAAPAFAKIVAATPAPAPVAAVDKEKADKEKALADAREQIFTDGKTAYEKKDWVKAITHLRPLAETGDDRAMVILGNMYELGLGVIPNHQVAMDLFKRAAITKNNTEAMVNIGSMFISARGVNTSYSTGLQWVKRAALLGNQSGAFVTGTLLARGNRTKEDRILADEYEAYKWFRIAERATPVTVFNKRAKAAADGIAARKITAEAAAKGDREVAAWKPVDAKTLGPVPVDPAQLPIKAPALRPRLRGVAPAQPGPAAK